MKIAAMAAGAVGAYFGGRMQAAGHDVAYIARRAHLDALRKDGLKIESVHGDLHLPKVNATPDPKEVGPVDVVLFAVKLWDTETAAELAKPLVGPNTRVITLQNGVDSYERVSAILGKEQTCPGTAYIAAVLGGPGVMRHTSKFATMRVGRMDGKPDARLAAFVEAAKAANIDIQPQDDMNRERWQKFIFLSSMAGVNCMMREPIGKVLADPDTRAFYKKLMEECLAVGQKSGAKVPSSWVDDRMTFSDNAPPGMKASMLHDLEAGNRLELDWLTGKIVALGKELGVPTPGSDAVYAAVKLHRMGKQGLVVPAGQTASSWPGTCPADRARDRSRFTAWRPECDHVAPGCSHPLGGHRRSAACHVPGRIGLPEGTFRSYAIDRIDHIIAALSGGRAGSETDTLGRGAAYDDRLDAASFQPLIEIVAQKFVGSTLLLIDNLAIARRDALVDDLAVAGHRVCEVKAGGARPVMQRLDGRDCRHTTGTLTAIFVHEVEHEKRRALGVDGHRLQRWRRRHLNRRPFGNHIIGGTRGNDAVDRRSNRHRRGA